MEFLQHPLSGHWAMQTRRFNKSWLKKGYRQTRKHTQNHYKLRASIKDLEIGDIDSIWHKLTASGVISSLSNTLCRPNSREEGWIDSRRQNDGLDRPRTFVTTKEWQYGGIPKARPTADRSWPFQATELLKNDIITSPSILAVYHLNRIQATCT